MGIMSLFRQVSKVSSLRNSSEKCRFFCSADHQQIKSVGFIGLGNMGFYMASNLLKAGFNLTVHDKCNIAVEKLADKGACIAHSPSEVANGSDAVITMLPSSQDVVDVYVGLNGLLSKESTIKPWLLIDSSTIDPYTSRMIAKRVSDSNLYMEKSPWKAPVMLDAPVSGGVTAAESGKLTFMIGGPKKGFLAAESLFQVMGKNSIYCGEAGNGSAAKICNNLAMAVSMAGISEAFSLGQQLGIDTQTLSMIFNCSSARCWSSDTYSPVPGLMDGVPSSNDYNGGFSCSLMKKDLGLAITASKDTGCNLPLTSKVHEMYSKLCDEGKGKKDFSGIFPYYYSGLPEK